MLVQNTISSASHQVYSLMLRPQSRRKEPLKLPSSVLPAGSGLTSPGRHTLALARCDAVFPETPARGWQHARQPQTLVRAWVRRTLLCLARCALALGGRKLRAAQVGVWPSPPLPSRANHSQRAASISVRRSVPAQTHSQRAALASAVRRAPAKRRRGLSIGDAARWLLGPPRGAAACARLLGVYEALDFALGRIVIEFGPDVVNKRGSDTSADGKALPPAVNADGYARGLRGAD